MIRRPSGFAYHRRLISLPLPWQRHRSSRNRGVRDGGAFERANLPSPSVDGRPGALFLDDPTKLAIPGIRRGEWADRVLRRVWCAVALMAVALLTGGGDPEIVRARVPSRDVSRWFPGGDRAARHAGRDFDSLVAGAKEGSLRQRAAEPPRLIRARHRAHFSSGVLTGHSEFVIEAARSGPADFILEPWTPAILSTPGTAPVVGARDSGKASLWIDQSPTQTIVLDWELHPRSQGSGQSFTLELPGNETTVLTLDVPGDWVPLCRQGRRRGPLKQHGRPRTRSRGRSNRKPAESMFNSIKQARECRSWKRRHGFPDRRKSTCGGRPIAREVWPTGRRNGGSSSILAIPRPLRIELDPGLELIDVQGPGRSWLSERALGNSTRLVITLDSGLATSTDLGSWPTPRSHRRANGTFRGSCRSMRSGRGEPRPCCSMSFTC